MNMQRIQVYGRLLRRRLERRRVSNETVLIAVALVIGVVGGVFAAFFNWAIQRVEHFAALFTDWGLHRSAVIVIAVLGGVLVGPITYWLAREAKGHGVPEVIYAIARRGARIRPRVVLVKSLASALTIGTGGSAGREGPIVQIGAGLGSAIGQALRFSERQLQTLVGCGAAAGIAATFNAPIAGSIFALEVLLGRFSTDTFGLVVIAAAVASVVGAGLLGEGPAFDVPQYELVAGPELILYALLGVGAALVGLLYVRVLYATEDYFDGLGQMPPYLKPAVGGLLFGIIGLYFPLTLGPGYVAMEGALNGNLLLPTLAGLVVLKILTTSFTLGAGGSGGVFAPGLYIGAMAGGAFGTIVHALFPASTVAPGAYALVGMGAVFSGATQAPITGILIIFEMTRDYHIIVPLMIACVISSRVAGWLSSESIYTLKLARRGIRLRGGHDVGLLTQLPVREAMTKQVQTARDDMTVGELVKLMQETHHTGYPVLDAEGRLTGIVTLEDVRNTDFKGRLERSVREVMTADPPVTFPDESLSEVSERLAVQGVGRLPVVDPDDPGRLVGLISSSDVLKTYHRALLNAEEGESPSLDARTRVPRERKGGETRGRSADT